MSDQPRAVPDDEPQARWWLIATEDWRERLLDLALRVGFLFGLVVYVPSMYLAYSAGLPLVAIVDTIAMAGVAGLHFFRRLAFEIRALLFALICYMLGVGLLISVGPISQIYLLGYSLLATLLLGQRAAVISVAINAVTLFVVGVVGSASPTMQIPGFDTNLAAWSVVSLNFLLVNAVLAISLGVLIAALERAVRRANRARAEAEREAEDRQAAVEALSESETRFRELAENIEDVFYSQDAVTGEMRYVSPAYEQTWGRSCESLHKAPLSYLDAVHPEDRSSLDKARKHRAADAPLSIDYRIVRPDGDVRWIHDRSFPVFGNAGARLVGTARDVTDQRKLEKQMLRMQRMDSLGTLAGGIAHDLNNILAPILLSVDFLAGRVQDEEDCETVAQIRSSAKRGAALVAQVLTFARGTGGQRILSDPTAIAHEVSRFSRETFPKSIDIVCNAPDDTWTVLADPTQVYQVLTNLCVNSRDAMPGGGRLTIEIRNTFVDEMYAGMNLKVTPGPYVQLVVEDTGEGIPKEIQDRIFEPFFTTKELGHGTGLGLTTTFSIVRDHGGFINLYSEPGKGAQFNVYLPASSAKAETREDASRHSELPRGSGELILLVDDEVSIREAAQLALERHGYRVLTASNGAEGVALFTRHHSEIAAVLTDMNMPVMDGPSMIIALRSIDPNVRIVGSSGLPANGHVARAVGAGVEHFVPKPYTTEALLTTLAAVLGADAAITRPE